MTKIAINGIGRVGKLLLRDLLDTGIDGVIVLLNDKTGDAEMHALLLEFDTVHGRWGKPVSVVDGGISAAGSTMTLSNSARIEDMDLTGIDVVIDCTGTFKTVEKTQAYFDAGVKKVVVSAPIKKAPALDLVYGINHHLYDPETHHLVSAASCTTNCLAPVVKVLHEEIGIQHGSMTTIHDVTNTQTILDRPAKDLRRARSAVNAMIPTTTGSATAITVIYPELKGRLNGHAVRVPMVNGSLTDCVFEMQRETTVEEVNALFKKWADGPLSGVLGYEERPLVSADFLHDSRSSIVDGPSTLVVNGTQVKVYAWYDNEWGYSCRLGDIARMVVSSL